MTVSADSVLELLRTRGLRMTPQRRAIVAEIMGAEGHISPMVVARRVRDRVPGVNPSTVYRTLTLLEDLGIISHAHLETYRGGRNGAGAWPLRLGTPEHHFRDGEWV